MTTPPQVWSQLHEMKADLFKGLAHPARIRVLELLSTASEVPVPELLAATGLSASNLSQHLSVLRRQNLVMAKRRGPQRLYSLAYPQVAELISVATLLLNHTLAMNREQLETFGTEFIGAAVEATAGPPEMRLRPAAAARMDRLP
jgi:DNA-binding transcriptional ArsR family regulator